MDSLTLTADPSGDLSRTVSHLYRKTGVFDWAERLRRHGVESPVRAIFLIGCTLASPPSDGVPAEDAAAQLWIDQALARAWQRHEHQPVKPLNELAAWVVPALQWEWDPWGELADLMAVRCGPAVLRFVRSQLASKGLNVDYIELHDLAAQFAGDHIRSALVSFDTVRGEGKEAAWLGTVFYRFALKHVLISRRMHQVFDVALQVSDPGVAPEDVLEQRVEHAALQALPRALARLQPTQREAVLRYFGLGYHEHTLAEVAQALSTNVYFARIAVVSGVGAVAAVLGIQGLLDSEELRVAQLMFTQGHDIDSAALALDVTPAHVRRVASHMGEKLRQSLRARTTSASTATTTTTTTPFASIEMESDMSLVEVQTAVQKDVQTELLSAFVAACTGGKTRLSRDRAGELWAEFDGAEERKRVAPLLRALRQQPVLLDTLVDGTSDECLAELLTPSPSETRQDLLPDHAAWSALLDQASASSTANAALVVREWAAACHEQRVDLPAGADEAELAKRVRDSLSAVTSALEDAMPWSFRQEGHGVLQLAFPDPLTDPLTATAYWSSSAQLNAAQALDLGRLLRDRLELVGRFQAPSVDLLAGCVLRDLREQALNLPGFTRAKSRAEGRVAYDWWRADVA